MRLLLLRQPHPFFKPNLGFVGIDSDAALILWPFKLDEAVNQGEEGVVVADPDSNAGMKLCASLANQDHAWLNHLAPKPLHAKALGVRISSVLS
jgi:hypothetical protein